jgi:hypothetical protein
LKKKKTPDSTFRAVAHKGRRFTEVVVPKQPKPASEYEQQSLITSDDFTVETDGKGPR